MRSSLMDSSVAHYVDNTHLHIHTHTLKLWRTQNKLVGLTALRRVPTRGSLCARFAQMSIDDDDDAVKCCRPFAKQIAKQQQQQQP